jgi:TnpA family transposase
VRQNYLRAETLTVANVRLVAAQNGIDLARRWGGGDVASADGLRFIVPVRTIHAGPNPKYFGPSGASPTTRPRPNSRVISRQIACWWDFRADRGMGRVELLTKRVFCQK